MLLLIAKDSTKNLDSNFEKKNGTAYKNMDERKI